jgi:hypothetical protein
MYIHLSSFNCLAQLELVNVDVFELGLESLSCLGNDPDRLLVITVNDWGNVGFEVKLSWRKRSFHQIISKAARLRAYSSALVVDLVTDRCLVDF